MSRATSLPPARTLALFAAATLVALAALLSFGAPSAEAATPCWKRALDDWSDDGRMDDVYSQECIQAAIDHLPEDLRIYSNAPEIIGGARQDSVRDRSLLGTSGSPTPPKTPARTVTPVEPEVESETGPRDEGPIPYVLGQGTTDASSIPLPLMILGGLALALMAAGAAGFTHRKLRARRISSGQ
jgi:hypothetical protein